MITRIRRKGGHDGGMITRIGRKGTTYWPSPMEIGRIGRKGTTYWYAASQMWGAQVWAAGGGNACWYSGFGRIHSSYGEIVAKGTNDMKYSFS